MLCTRRLRSPPTDLADTSLALTGALEAPAVTPVVLVGLSPVGLLRIYADASERARRTRVDDDDLTTVLPDCAVRWRPET